MNMNKVLGKLAKLDVKQFLSLIIKEGTMYVALLKQFVRGEDVHVTKITEEIWPDKNWKEVGAVIEVDMGERRQAHK